MTHRVFSLGESFFVEGLTSRPSRGRMVRTMFHPHRRRQTLNNNEKQSIREMRLSGLGYKKIAQALGVSLATVQSFCRREGLVAQEAVLCDEKHCLQCAKPLVQRDKVKKRKFCSKECRVAWWTAHPCAKSGNTKSSRAVVCANCGKPFTAYGKDVRKYCSHECYVCARYGGNAR